MSNERDELAAIIKPAAAHDYWPQKAAELALAAGYRKPRQVTTVEELDALPVGSTILDVEQDAWQRMASGVWWCVDQVNGHPSAYLPLTVLHVGSTA